MYSDQVCVANFRKTVDKSATGCTDTSCKLVHYEALKGPITKATVKNAFEQAKPGVFKDKEAKRAAITLVESFGGSMMIK